MVRLPSIDLEVSAVPPAFETQRPSRKLGSFSHRGSASAANEGSRKHEMTPESVSASEVSPAPTPAKLDPRLFTVIPAPKDEPPSPQHQFEKKAHIELELQAEVQRLQMRLSKSEELIKQLKHVIKAQHTKIEDLRKDLQIGGGTGGATVYGSMGPIVARHIDDNAQRDHEKTRETNEQLNRNCRRLKIELDKVRSENDTLRKAGRRMKGILSDHMPMAHALELYDPSMRPQSEATGPSLTKQMIASGEDKNRPPALEDIHLDVAAIKDQQAQDLDGALTNRHHKSPASPSYTEDRGSVVALQGQVAAPRGQGAAMKLSRMAAIVPAFWKDQTGPRSVLLSLLDKAAKLLSDGPGTPTVTLYMMDPWLRSSATDNNEQPTLYYLQGKVTLQVLQIKKDKAEVPRFADLHSLPIRTKQSLALTVQTPSTHRKLAVLQAIMEKDSLPHQQGHRSHLLGGQGEDPTSSLPRKADEAAGSGFTDTHLLCLQIACNVVGGVLEQYEEMGVVKRSQARVRDCVEIAAAVNKAKSLSDFEHRMKLSLGQYFRVNMVRVLFYDFDAGELLVSAAQSQVKTKTPGGSRRMRKQGCCVFGLDKGIVGICAKRQTTKPLHVPKILQNPYIDMAADGLDMLGKPPGGESGMMCGAMVFEHDDGPRLMGVLQLVERIRDKGGIDGAPEDPYAPSGAFTAEEESLFETLLQICAISAWRTFQSQQMERKEAGSPPGLAHMLAG